MAAPDDAEKPAPTAPAEALAPPAYVLDLRLCHKNSMCVSMKRDLEAAAAKKADAIAVQRMMYAVETGRCTYCGRRVR